MSKCSTGERLNLESTECFTNEAINIGELISLIQKLSSLNHWGDVAVSITNSREIASINVSTRRSNQNVEIQQSSFSNVAPLSMQWPF